MEGATEKLLTLPEVAALLQVTVSTLRSWKRQKRNLTFRKIGHSLRIRRVDVDSLIARSAQEPNEPKAARKRGAK